MKAVDSSLLALLKKSSQFVVPIFQRQYSWTESECEQLWNDVVNAGGNDAYNAHFTGSIVYVADGASTITSSSPHLIIDGQQRVTTVSLLLAALANQLEERVGVSDELLEGFSARKIRDRYLMDPNEDGDKRFKLLLSAGDRAAFKSIVAGHTLDGSVDSRLVANSKFFESKLRDTDELLIRVCKGLDKLVVVDVKLERGVDNPQLVFESMNSTGKKLSQADLVRNFVLMDLEPAIQSDLYERHWRPMELLFVGAEDEHFDAFMRHFLTIQTGQIPRIGDVYDAFKNYAFGESAVGQSISSLIEKLHAQATHYSRISLGRETDSRLKSCFSDIEQIKADVVLPFVLRLYDDYEVGKLSLDDFVEILKMVVSYVFRRVICRIPTNSLNKTFAGFNAYVEEENYVESVAAHFLSLQSYRAFPTDEEFEQFLTTSDVYNFRRRSFLLRSLENFGRKEKVSIEEYTIEHILPQNPELKPEWRDELGPEWKSIQEKYLHTLGNLTLTAYNSEMSDHPFKTKRDIEGGFGSSPLALNKGLGALDAWGPDEIESRARLLALTATQIWSRPDLPPEVIAKYSKETVSEGSTYQLEDHANLFVSPQRFALFEKLNHSLLALDPAVYRDVRKQYIAYKAETNFVDVIPQKGNLILSIVVPAGELFDTRNLARDVSAVGRWGNGSYEVELNEDSDFDYVLGLVRQAFERQLGTEI